MSENEYQIRLEKGLVLMILISILVLASSLIVYVCVCYNTHNIITYAYLSMVAPLPHYLPDQIILLFLTLRESSHRSKGRK